jgi:hypothetical protein
MKLTVIIGAVAGIILSVCGYLALFSGLAEMETTQQWNLLACVGYALMLPTMFLNYVKNLTRFESATVETLAMVIIQVAWYIGIAVLIRQLVSKKNRCEQPAGGDGVPPPQP